MIYRLTWWLVRIAFKLLFRWRITGAENVPTTGPVLLAANHVSYMDPPVAGVGVWRPGSYLAKEELFHNPVFAWYIRRLNAFPVKRGGGDRAALKKCLDILEEGRALVMFPEGTRSADGQLQEAEIGVGMIAYRSGAPVVPAYIRGTGEAMPRKGGLSLVPISVRYGQPMRFTAAEGQKPGREEYEAAARAIMEAIAALRDQDLAEYPPRERLANP